MMNVVSPKRFHFSLPSIILYFHFDRKTITNQKTFLIKKTGTLLVEAAYKELALPSMTCPLTSKTFTTSDVIELVSAASAFAASGEVTATKHRYTIN